MLLLVVEIEKYHFRSWLPPHLDLGFVTLTFNALKFAHNLVHTPDSTGTTFKKTYCIMLMFAMADFFAAMFQNLLRNIILSLSRRSIEYANQFNEMKIFQKVKVLKIVAFLQPIRRSSNLLFLLFLINFQ